jgi:hypothetical protein
MNVKIDTGAQTSSLHARHVVIFSRRGKMMARFEVLPHQRNSHDGVVVEAPYLEHRQIRSSNGLASRRPVVLLTIDLGGYVYPIEVTLASREMMGYRMLLGRQALKKKFCIDPGRSYLLTRLLKESGSLGGEE